MLISKRPFQDGEMCRKNALFKAHCQQVPKTSPAEHRRSYCEKNKRFFYLALQFKELVILLQDTHFTNAEKLALPNF